MMEKYVWELIDKYDSGKIDDEKFVQTIIQWWMMDVKRCEE